MILSNQVALIAGGSSGIGAACAKYLQEQGMRVVIWDKQKPVSLSKDVNFIECDVQRDASVDAALTETIKRVGVPRVCVNCAGIAPAQRIVGKEHAMPLQDFKYIIDVNLVGTFNVMRVAAFAMSQLKIENSTERGVIINTASIAAFEGQIGQAAYSASKGGIVAMTLPAARELAQHAIRVNTIAPGLIATPLLLNMPKAVQEQLHASVPFPKRLGKPHEFAALVAHIIENEFINGEVIRLDGALRMH